MADRGKKKKGIKCNGVQVSLIEENLTVVGYEKTMVIKGGRKQRFHFFFMKFEKEIWPETNVVGLLRHIPY